MNTALWIVAGVLTAVYLISGFVKLFMPHEKLAKTTRAAEWVLDFSPGAVKAIGAAEVAGAIGLTLPAAVDIAPVLVPGAALGLALIMAGAVAVRMRRHEPKYALVDVTYLALVVFVAIARFGPASFTG